MKNGASNVIGFGPGWVVREAGFEPTEAKGLLGGRRAAWEGGDHIIRWMER